MQPITDVQTVFRYQRAIRAFTNEEVPDDLVHQVLTAAIHGPSGSNTQPWHFIVVRDPSMKQAIGAVYEEARAAGPRGRAPRGGGRAGALDESGRTDCGPRRPESAPCDL